MPRRAQPRNPLPGTRVACVPRGRARQRPERQAQETQKPKGGEADTPVSGPARGLSSQVATESQRLWRSPLPGCETGSMGRTGRPIGGVSPTRGSCGMARDGSFGEGERSEQGQGTRHREKSTLGGQTSRKGKIQAVAPAQGGSALSLGVRKAPEDRAQSAGLATLTRPLHSCRRERIIAPSCWHSLQGYSTP